jgi:hypothetical protein
VLTKTKDRVGAVVVAVAAVAGLVLVFSQPKGGDDDDRPGTSQVQQAPGQDDDAPAPGQAPAAPGQDQDDAPAPGQDQDGAPAPGQAPAAPGQQPPAGGDADGDG